MKTIIHSSDEIEGVFKYNINGFNELIVILVKINVETYEIEGAIFSVIRKGVDVGMFSLENIMKQQIDYIVPSTEFKGDSAFRDVVVKALEYIYLNKDNYMQFINEEIVNILINDLIYIDSVRKRRLQSSNAKKKKTFFTKLLKWK